MLNYYYNDDKILPRGDPMQISLSEILKLDTFKQAQVLAGFDNLDKAVSFNFVIDSFPDLQETLTWLRDDLLVFVLGHSIANQPGKLAEILEMLEDFKIPGVIVYVNKYIKEIPGPVIRAFQEANMPLITIPWQVKYIDVSNEIFSAIARKQLQVQEQSDILSQILFDPHFDCQDNYLRLQQLNYADDVAHCIMVAKINNLKHHARNHNLSETAIIELKEHFHSTLRGHFLLNGFNFISMIHGDTIIFLMEKQATSDFNSQMALLPEFTQDGLSLDFGIGMDVFKLEELAVSYSQAKNVIDAKNRKLIGHDICHFGNLGIFQILYTTDIATLKQLYPNKIRPVIEYDNTHNSNLLDTLEVYLDNKNSLAAAAKIMYVHKNTILYRIDKINSLIEINNFNIFNLLYEIKIYRYLLS